MYELFEVSQLGEQLNLRVFMIDLFGVELLHYLLSRVAFKDDKG